jgi:hypothetical protein
MSAPITLAEVAQAIMALEPSSDHSPIDMRSRAAAIVDRYAAAQAERAAPEGERSELPALPESKHEISYQRPSGQWGRLEGYTADEMRAYARAALASAQPAPETYYAACDHCGRIPTAAPEPAPTAQPEPATRGLTPEQRSRLISSGPNAGRVAPAAQPEPAGCVGAAPNAAVPLVASPSTTVVVTSAAQPVAQAVPVAMTREQIDTHIGPDEGDRDAVEAIVRDVEHFYGAAPPAPKALSDALECLQEFADIQALNDKASAIHFAGPLSTEGDNWRETFKSMSAEYRTRYHAVWDRARAILAAAAAMAPKTPEPDSK